MNDLAKEKGISVLSQIIIVYLIKFVTAGTISRVSRGRISYWNAFRGISIFTYLSYVGARSVTGGIRQADEFHSDVKVFANEVGGSLQGRQ